MKTRYSEKLVENALRDFPEDFLGEPLKLLYQQPTIGGFRPDLLFQDSNGTPLIVEVQLNALDRNHLYRALEYRDLYKEKTECDRVRVALFCNSIPSRFESILASHSVDCLKIGKREFVKKLRQLAPNIKIATSTRKKTLLRQLTPKKLLAELQKPETKLNGLFPPDTIAYWTGWGSRRARCIHNRYLDYRLKELSLGCDGFLDREKIYEKNDYYEAESIATIKTQTGKVEACVPFECFVGGEVFKNMRMSQVRNLQGWLGLISDTFWYKENEGKKDVEIGLGGSCLGDLYGWMDYIDGRKKKLHFINEYGLRVGYDLAKIKSDIKLLHNIRIHTGKYPDFVEERVFVNFEASHGPPKSRLHSYEEKRQELIQLGYNDAVQELDKRAQRNAKEWICIRFEKVSQTAVEAVRYLMWHIHIHLNDFGSLGGNCHVCLSKPRKANEIPKGALKLSSKFFLHVRPSSFQLSGTNATRHPS